MLEEMKKQINFEELCGQLFENLNFDVQYDKKIPKSNVTHYVCDLFLTKDNINTIVEIKLFRTRKPTEKDLERAIHQLHFYEKELQVDKKLLIVGNNLDNELKDSLQSKYDIEILDFANLLYLSNDFKELNKKLLSFINSSIIDKEVKEKIPDKSFFTKNNIHIQLIDQENNDLEEKYTCQELLKIEKGVGSVYEIKCTEILKYLFDTDLSGWFEQQKTDDDLSRFDLVCRVNKKDNAFWNLIIDEFKSRYIVFEFKNYKDEIKQTQIYTTEKYLFQRALRNVAFIISRKGADKNTIKVTKGILRETGKLIINLTDNDLCKMLELKQSGGEPADFLFEKVDDFLLKMEK